MKHSLLYTGNNKDWVCLRNGHRKTFAPKDWEVMQGWRKVHNKKFHNLYSSKNSTAIMKLRTGWSGQSIWQMRNQYKMGKCSMWQATDLTSHLFATTNPRHLGSTCFKAQFWTNTKQVFSFWSDAVQNSVLLGPRSLSLGVHCPTFWECALVSSSRVNSPMKNVKAGEYMRQVWPMTN